MRPPPWHRGPPPHDARWHAMHARRREMFERRRGWGVWWFIRAKLHRRLFVSYAASILVTVVIAGAVTNVLHRGPTWRDEAARVETFVAGRFESAWTFPAQRDELARSLARDLDVDITLSDPDGRDLGTFTPSGPRTAPACERPAWNLPIGRAPQRMGAVRVCIDRHGDPRAGRPTWVALAVVVMVLWIFAGFMARRLTRPLSELVRVVQDIGAGRLASRMQLGRHDAGELGAIAHAVNDMAARIERQIEDQKNLLAAVSHEIRSPLARLRFLMETLRDDDPARGRTLDDVDREMDGIDVLVGDLLATSRLDFEATKRVPLDAAEVAVRAMERAGLDVTLCTVEGDDLRFEGDATLVATALANLLSNARKHGGAVVALRVWRDARGVCFAVDDDGEGFSDEALQKAFEPFYRGDAARRGNRAGVGLGLALVRRIAEVHGGTVWAENREARGARVGVAFGMRSV